MTSHQLLRLRQVEEKTGLKSYILPLQPNSMTVTLSIPMPSSRVSF